MKWTTLSAFVAIILVSALAFAGAALLEAGHNNTPYGTQDSKGHPLGFNDPLTWELCRIMLRNASWAKTWEVTGIYGLAYFIAHVVGLNVLLLTRRKATSKIRERFFLLQLVMFPTGWLGAWVFPWVFFWFLAGKIDGETISDGPTFWWIFQPIWFAVSAAITLHSVRNRASAPAVEASGLSANLRQ